jgi:hypothetical protein
MQVFGVCQLSELKGWRRGSPDNQAAIRRAAVGSWRHRWQKTPYHGPAAHIGCGASDRPHAVPGRGDPGRRWLQVQGRIRASLSGQGGIRPYELPPNRPQIKAPSSAVMDHALRILRLLGTAPLRRSPQSNTQKACNISTTSTDHTVPLPDKLRPATSKNAEPKRPHPSHTYLSRTRD